MSSSAERKRHFPRQRYWWEGRGLGEYFRVPRPAASLRAGGGSGHCDAFPLPVAGNFQASHGFGRAAGANLRDRRWARLRSGGFRPRGRFPPQGWASAKGRPGRTRPRWEGGSAGTSRVVSTWELQTAPGVLLQGQVKYREDGHRTGAAGYKSKSEPWGPEGGVAGLG